MINKKPICILFAGPVGCSKTPVAYYLSWNLGLPIFNNDAVRTEIHEDSLSESLDQELYLGRRNERLERLISSKKDFIFDASIDRTWPELSEKLAKQGYSPFIISFNLSSEFLEKTFKAKKYDQIGQISNWCRDHQNFLSNYQEEVDITIDDSTFGNRLEESLVATRNFIAKLE